MIKNRDISDAIEAVAPLSLQETWDNSGWQIGRTDDPCTGVLLCVDVTPQVVDEAVRLGCNLIVSHHPLIFKGMRQITGDNLQQEAVLRAIRAGISVYSSHTSIDNAEDGVSCTMAQRLGIAVEGRLTDTGTGAYGTITPDLNTKELVHRVKAAFKSPVARCSKHPLLENGKISSVALCGGSGASLIADAVARGAQAYITSDVKYHDFLDWGERIFLIDIGHFEAEECTKDIFYQIITQKFANFAVYKSTTQNNPIGYY